LLLVPLVVVLLVSGCTSTSHHRPAPTATSGKASAKSYGDVVGLRTVSDARGSYLQTTYDARLPSYRLESRVLEDSTVARDRWSHAEVLSSQQWILRFVTEQLADSTIADDPLPDSLAWKAFTTGVVPRLVDQGSVAALTTADSGLVFRNPDGPIMIEDGHPRLSGEVVYLGKITSERGSGESMLVFSGLSIVRYRIADADLTADFVSKGNSAAMLAARFPQLSDGNEETEEVNVNWTFGVIRHGSTWRIVEYRDRSFFHYVGF
jgi:hypothetical protein